MTGTNSIIDLLGNTSISTNYLSGFSYSCNNIYLLVANKSAFITISVQKAKQVPAKSSLPQNSAKTST